MAYIRDKIAMELELLWRLDWRRPVRVADLAADIYGADTKANRMAVGGLVMALRRRGYQITSEKDAWDADERPTVRRPGGYRLSREHFRLVVAAYTGRDTSRMAGWMRKCPSLVVLNRILCG